MHLMHCQARPLSLLLVILFFIFGGVFHVGSIFHVGSLPREGFEPVHLCSLLTKENFTTHPYTARGWRAHELFHPFFLDLKSFFSMQPRLRVLELGIGNGHALLDLQSMYPYSTLHGTNLDSYAFPQARGQADLLLSAAHYKIPTWCRSGGTYILPRVFLVPSFAEPDNALGRFEAEDYELILSLHALNNKLPPSSTHVYLPRLVRLLAPGGMAVLHVGDAILPRSTPEFAVVDSFSTGSNMGKLSFVLHMTRIPPSPTHLVGLVIRRCSDTDLTKTCVAVGGVLSSYQVFEDSTAVNLTTSSLRNLSRHLIRWKQLLWFS